MGTLPTAYLVDAAASGTSCRPRPRQGWPTRLAVQQNQCSFPAEHRMQSTQFLLRFSNLPPPTSACRKVASRNPRRRRNLKLHLRSKGQKEVGKRRVQTNQAKRKTRRRRNQAATATTIAATHSHSRKRKGKNRRTVMWTCMNSFNNAAISKQGPVCIKVARPKVPLLLRLYGKGEFFVVAHQGYAIHKRASLG
uniref:Uncharacterized protein n=1 Tax=Setaria viridis TaxID=4556 RepID=A0A4U6U0Q0_SETVI|nr:hypothetical protein SEVIR_7G267133v2 [Setaria viridis]